MNKQTVLTIISVIGVSASVAVTAVMAPKAHEAIKAKKLEIAKTQGKDIEKDRHGYPTKMSLTRADKLELVKTAAPYILPTTFLYTLTIGVIIFNHHVNSKALLGLSATTSYLVANRDKLKKIANKPEVKKLVGTVYPQKEEFKHQTIEETGNGDLLCIDGYSGRIFRSSQDAVVDAQEKLVEQYLDEEDGGQFGYACYNDYFRFLNIEQSQWGQDYGWANNEDYYLRNEPIQFSNELIAADAPGNDYGEPIFCTDLEDIWYPMQCWQEV